MTESTQVEMRTEEFLKTIANLLSQTFKNPEYSNLFAPEGQSKPGALIVATPDEIETALVIALQQAEITMQEIAEDNRIAEQWKEFENITKRNNEPRPMPTNLEIVEKTLPDISLLTNNAAQAIQNLFDTLYGPDDAFKDATEAAIRCLNERDEGINLVHEEIHFEVLRRQNAIKKTEKDSSKCDEELEDIAKQNLANRKDLEKRLQNIKEAINTQLELLKSSTMKNSARYFDDCVLRCENAIKEKSSHIRIINSNLTGEQKDSRAEQFFKMNPFDGLKSEKYSLLLLNDLELEMIDQELAAEHRTKLSNLAKAYNELKTHYKQFGFLPEWQSRFDEVKNKHNAVLESKSLTSSLATKEQERRRVIVDQLQKEKSEVKSPTLPKGSEEEKIYLKSMDETQGFMKEVQGFLLRGTIDEFEKAVSKTEESIENLKNGAEKGTQAEERRQEILKQLHTQIDEIVHPVIEDIKSKLTSKPSFSVQALLKEAFERDVQSKRDTLKNISEKSYGSIVDCLKKLAEVTDKLINGLMTINHNKYSVVEKNVQINDQLNELREELTNKGINHRAIEIVDQLPRDIDNLVDVYIKIDSTKISYNKAISDPKIEPISQLQLSSFPSFEEARDTLGKGDLNSRLNIFIEAIEKIEDRRFANEIAAMTEAERKKWENSFARRFHLMMDHPLSHENPIETLEEYVRQDIVKTGSTLSAYTTRYDVDPGSFSVKFDVLIQDYIGVVTHAHCDQSGTPGEGNACHIKLLRYETRDRPSYELSGFLRQHLLPSPGLCKAAAEAYKIPGHTTTEN